jgi:hypothetical protein
LSHFQKRFANFCSFSVVGVERRPLPERWGVASLHPSHPGRFLMRGLCSAIFVIAALRPGGPAAAFNSFHTFTSLEDSAGTIIVSDVDEGTDLIDPIAPNTAFTSFIGGGNFKADAYVDTNAIIAVEAGMTNRRDKLTSSASFSLDIENPSPAPRRMDLGFLIFPGQLRLIANNAEVSFDISVSVVGDVIQDADGLIPRFEAGGTLATDASGVTTWTAFGEDINLPPSGPSTGTINIPLSAPTLTAFFGGNAKGNIRYDMSVTIDATDAVAGGGFLEFATANFSDPLMPGMSEAIQSITFSEIPEPATAGLAHLGLAAAVGSRRRRQSLHFTA